MRAWEWSSDKRGRLMLEMPRCRISCGTCVSAARQAERVSGRVGRGVWMIRVSIGGLGRGGSEVVGVVGGRRRLCRDEAMEAWTWSGMLRVGS